MGSTGLLVSLGLVMVLSASSVTSYASSGSSFTIAEKQAMWVAVGLPAMWVAMRMPVRFYRLLGYPLLLGAGALLVVVLVPGVGVNVGGATRWIALPGGFQVQPSEFAKLALVLWGADLLARKEKRLTETRHLIVPLVPLTLFMAALVMLQPDLGTTTVLLLIMLALLWTAGTPFSVFAILGALVGAAGGLLAVTEPYRLARLTGFTNPCAMAKAQDAGYQACQGLFALSSGGWFGLGLGASREKFGYLPNQYTDYIFAIIGEELGLLGTMTVLVLFAVLGLAGIRIAMRCKDPFGKYLVAGATTLVAGQAIVNFGAVLGFLPLTGVPLPLISSGGSSLVVMLSLVGVMLNVADSRAASGASAKPRTEPRDGTATESRPKPKPARADRSGGNGGARRAGAGGGRRAAG
jgi:cell division protein FtsW